MGIGFNNRKKGKADGTSGSGLADFEKEMVDLNSTGVFPELNEANNYEAPEIDAEFDAKYSDENEDYFNETEEYFDEAEDYTDDGNSAQDVIDDVDGREDILSEDAEVYPEDIITEDSDEYPVDDMPEEVDEIEDEDVSSDENHDLREDEYINLDEGMESSHAGDRRGFRLPAKSTVIKILAIAAACIALFFVGFIAVKGINRGKDKSPAGNYVDGIFVSDAMKGAGSEISDITMIGERGLIAALDARAAAAMAAQDAVIDEIDSPASGYEETDLISNVSVGFELITVKSDLKVSILNSSTGKLIPNVPFKVTVTGPDGKKTEWSDDDLDGIIYKTSLAEGKYTVCIEALEGDKYQGYSWPADKSANVKSTIAYTGVDVKNEVKKADQINESAEDTASRGGTSQLDVADTVEFVESSSQPEYKEISKDLITNPSASLGFIDPDISSVSPFYILTGTENSGSSDSSGASNSGDNGAGDGSTANNGGTGNDSTDDGNNTGDSTGTDTDSSNKDDDKKEDEHKEVEKPTVKITLSSSSQKLNSGSSFTFTASVSFTVAPGYELTVSSSDSSVASASFSDETITVKAEKAGSADITVTATTTTSDAVKDKVSDQAKCTITVVSVDMSASLKDNSGNEVYVLENGKYRAATNADYAKFDKFYILSGTKYTGWQTIGGSTYYYDKNGKAVTGTQVIQGVTYQFASDGKMASTTGVLGIDVSKWNGNIDWAAVKAAGVQYVIIRIGYRGSTAGALIDDSKFTTNIAGAKAAGLGVGVYFVTQAVNDVEAVYEASMVIDRLRGYSLEYPVFLDVEPSGGRGDLIDKNTRTAVCIAFCETIRNAGYTPGIYANKSWFETKMNASQLSSYKIWVAHYSSVCGYTGRYDYWQYTDKGRVSGISGNVDYNLKYT